MKKVLLGLVVVTFITGFAYAATPAQCAVLKGAGFTGICNLKTLVTKEDVNLGISKGVAGAKKFLTSRASNLRKSKAPILCSGNKNIERLNNTFAVCSANFIKAYESVYGTGSVKVVSGFRPGREQGDGCGSNAAAGGVPNSNHTKGLAIDVNPFGKGSYKTLYNFARLNPNLGVCFPHYGWDNPHMTLAGGSGREARKCAAQGVKTQCSGAPKFNPNKNIYGSSGNGRSRLSSSRYENRQGTQSTQQPPQTPKPPSGGAPKGSPQSNARTKAGNGYNPYSNKGNGGRDGKYDSVGGEGNAPANIASITCDPGTIGGTERALIEWSCGGQSTRSRGGTTRLQSRFNTKGRLTGRGYTRPREGTSYKIQCLDGDKVIGAAVCRINVDVASTSAVAGDATRAVLHLSTSEPSVEWGGSTSLQWATIGASNCKVRGGRIREDRDGGSADTGRLYRPTVYILRCDTSNGSKLVKTEVKIR